MVKEVAFATRRRYSSRRKECIQGDNISISGESLSLLGADQTHGPPRFCCCYDKDPGTMITHTLHRGGTDEDLLPSVGEGTLTVTPKFELDHAIDERDRDVMNSLPLDIHGRMVTNGLSDSRLYLGTDEKFTRFVIKVGGALISQEIESHRSLEELGWSSTLLAHASTSLDKGVLVVPLADSPDFGGEMVRGLHTRSISTSDYLRSWREILKRHAELAELGPLEGDRADGNNYLLNLTQRVRSAELKLPQGDGELNSGDLFRKQIVYKTREQELLLPSVGEMNSFFGDLIPSIPELPAAASHGDFHALNVVQHSGEIEFIDLPFFQVNGDPGRDLGKWLHFQERGHFYDHPSCQDKEILHVSVDGGRIEVVSQLPSIRFGGAELKEQMTRLYADSLGSSEPDIFRVRAESVGLAICLWRVAHGVLHGSPQVPARLALLADSWLEWCDVASS